MGEVPLYNQSHNNHEEDDQWELQPTIKSLKPPNLD